MLQGFAQIIASDSSSYSEAGHELDVLIRPLRLFAEGRTPGHLTSKREMTTGCHHLYSGRGGQGDDTGDDRG